MSFYGEAILCSSSAIFSAPSDARALQKPSCPKPRMCVFLIQCLDKKIFVVRREDNSSFYTIAIGLTMIAPSPNQRPYAESKAKH